MIEKRYKGAILEESDYTQLHLSVLTQSQQLLSDHSDNWFFFASRDSTMQQFLKQLKLKESVGRFGIGNYVNNAVPMTKSRKI